MTSRMLAAWACAAAGTLPGCVGYGTAYEGDARAFETPNAPAISDVIATSLRWVVMRYPPREEWVQTLGGLSGVPEGGDPGQPYTVNLPAYTRFEVYDAVLARLGQGVDPLTPESAERLPVYHVTRARVRGDEARVDVLRPVVRLSPDPGGRSTYQGITLHLRGGIRPWRVVTHATWSAGSLTAPGLNFPYATGAADDTLEAPATWGAPIPAPDSEPARGPEAAPAGDPGASTQAVE